MARNPIYDQFITKQGVQYEYIEVVNLDDINIEKSKQNQVRITQAVIPELVTRYRQAVRDRDEFPPFVLHRPTSKSKYILLDGVNRYVAMSGEKRKTHDAYIIKTDEIGVLNRLKATINNHVNGQRMSYEELLWHAIELVRIKVLNSTQAAKECGVKEHELRFKIRELELRELLDSKNVEHRKIPAERLQELGPILPLGDDIYAKAAKVIGETGASSNDVKELVKEVKTAKNHDDKLGTIDRFAQSERMVRRRAETKGGTIVPSNPLPRDQFLRELNQLYRVLAQNNDVAIKPTRQDFEIAHEKAATIVDRLTIIFGLGVLPGQKEKRA